MTFLRVALISNLVRPSPADGLAEIVALATSAARQGAKIISFPEAALTGLEISGNPRDDASLGKTIPGPLTETLAAVCLEYGVCLSIGMLELFEGKLFDSAVMLDDRGQIVATHRRIDPDWHETAGEDGFYAQGRPVNSFETPLGKACFLICGDLFHPQCVADVLEIKPDVLFVPLSRSLPSDRIDQAEWDADINNVYRPQVARLRTTALIVNSLETGRRWSAIGGAMAISETGELLAASRIGREDILYLSL